MTTKASATATVESAVESPKRVKASTKKSTRKSTPRSSKAASPSTKKSGPKPSATKTTVVEATIAAVVEKPKPRASQAAGGQSERDQWIANASHRHLSLGAADRRDLEHVSGGADAGRP